MINKPLTGKFLKCLGCDKECYVRRYRVQTFKYCSRSCKDKFGCTQQIKTNCNICQKEFEHISSRCNKAKYCSRKCYYKSQNKPDRGTIQYNCIHCGIIFKDSPCKNRKYCSISCTRKNARENWHPKFTTVRKKMLKEGLINSCEHCGYNEVKEILGVHHKDGKRENNSKENLVVLCPNCHSLVHRKHISH